MTVVVVLNEEVRCEMDGFDSVADAVVEAISHHRKTGEMTEVTRLIAFAKDSKEGIAKLSTGAFYAGPLGVPVEIVPIVGVVEKCEGCNSPATTRDSEGVPLCAECAKVCDDGGLKSALPSGVKCIVHADRAATATVKVPCAPDGALPVCAECSDLKDDETARRVFEAYRAKHAGRIAGKKGLN